jgi:hypothetical protein
MLTVEILQLPALRSFRNWTVWIPLSQSQSHIATDGQSVSKSWCHDQIFIIVWQLRSWFCGAPSLTRGRVCLLYMLLALASAVFLRSESFGTRDHILLFQIWDFPFRRLLFLWAGLGSSLYSPGADPTENTVSQQYLHTCYGRLPSDSPGIVDEFNGRYKVTHVPSRNRCIATVLHVALYKFNTV